MREKQLLDIVNRIRLRKGSPELERLEPRATLLDDLEFDSIDLAELTVRIEDAFGVDVFESGLVRRLGEVMDRISAGVVDSSP